ncbi:MAG: hydrogenase small subunit [Deltaproteobacteria bacterium]|nr:hydrogenase small subunit [Deltaproteobacteria bacterium]RLB92163.1 MAG: Ni,Fe-hydrogenase small subunit [Deltaproteobacteria bacterium]RLB96207.1 MAG: Ni,Fe-hydrogenase small subunit [Deltaproteobacteria bacterium]RLC10489.1 MAG: Ni,Fe-hydrogenase small subunit [Deltaproteobacteria bacterium]
MNKLFGEISRRDFMKYCASTAAVLGLSQVEFVSKVSEALAAASAKPPVIWLEGQDCAGCTISFAGALNPPAASVILDKLSVRYHETLMAGAGYLSEAVYDDTLKEGGFVLVVEGSIPTADDRFCMVGGRPFKEMVEECGAKAAAVIAAGACSSFGGIPAAGPTKAVGANKIIKGKPVINLPTCPVHVDHLVGTILYFLTTGKAPALDNLGRPKMYFGQLIHDNCRRRYYFDNEMFLQDWNDPKQKDWCLYEKGCKGPDTYADCPIRRWNDGLNFCIDAGAPCQGCAEPDFYAGMSPLYTAESERSQKIMARKAAGLIPPQEEKV